MPFILHPIGRIVKQKTKCFQTNIYRRTKAAEKTKKHLFCKRRFFVKPLVGNVGKQSCLTGALDCGRQLALMLRTGAGHTAGKDLGALGNVLAKTSHILVIDHFDLFSAKSADLLLAAHSGAEGGVRCIISFH